MNWVCCNVVYGGVVGNVVVECNVIVNVVSN